MALLLLWLALALDGASALVMGGVGSQAARVTARSSPIRCESEMAWRRRMERERSGLPEPEAPAEAKAPEEAPAAEMVRPMPKPDMATSVDLLFDGGGIGMGQTDTFFGSDVFGSIGGGTLTRENAAAAMKVSSPALAAMDRLKEVVDDAGKLAPADEAELLSQTLDMAREAGVSDTSPYFKRALALLSAVENAAQTEPREAEVAAADALLDAKLDALFAGDFPIASLELDDA
jgi:hypothetical protein